MNEEKVDAEKSPGPEAQPEESTDAAAKLDTEPGIRAAPEEPVEDDTEPTARGEFDVPLDENERLIPEEFVQALGGQWYNVEGMTSSGATAMGPNASAYNVNVTTQRSPVWTRLYVAETLDAISSCYASTSADSEIDAQLADHGLACLVGKTGTGRKAAALMALRRRHGRDSVQEVCHAGEFSLKELLRADGLIAEDTGYLVSLPDQKLGWKDLQQLAVIAGRRRSSLMIITDATNVAEDYCVTHQTPDSSDVYWAHFEKCLSSRRTCPDTCIDPAQPCCESCVDTLRRLCQNSPDLSSMLRSIDRPDLAFRLAKDIVDTFPETEARLGVLLASQHRFRLDEARRYLATSDTNTVVENHREIQRQAHLVALAVFNGCSRGIVSDAAGLLVELVAPTSTTAPSIDPHRGFGDTFDTLIPDELRMPSHNGSFDDTAHIVHIDLIRAILEVMWRDYPGTRHLLLAWLDVLVTDQRAVMRSRASACAAYFAGFDLDVVFSRLITEWAGSWRARSRQAAATACVVACRNPLLRSQVLRYVQRWVRRREDQYFDTVARAYVSGLGSYVPDEVALQQITEVAGRPTQVRSAIVPAAVATLAEHGGVNAVLETVLEWSTGKEPLLQRQAARVIPALAEVTGGVVGAPPALLEWGGDDPDRREQLVALWRHALLYPASAFPAWKALGEWVNQGTFDIHIARLLRELITVACADPAIVPRLGFHLDRVWRIVIPDDPLILDLKALTNGENHAMVA